MVLEQQKLLSLPDHAVIAEERLHPQADEANAETKRLCQLYGIELPQLDDYNTMTAYMYPRTTVERLVATNLWLDFLWFVDDSFDRNIDHEYTGNSMKLRKILETSVEIICRGVEPSFEHQIFPVCQAIYEAFSRLSQPNWLEERFRIQLLRHLKAGTYEVEDIVEADGTVEPEKYMSLRELDSGMYPAINLLEVAFDIYLPDEVLEHPQIKRLEQLCCRVALMSNELFSYEKEVVKLGTRFNLVRVYEETYNLSFDEAVHCVIEKLNQETAEFLDLRNNVPSFNDPHVDEMTAKYVLGLEDHVNAAYWWQISTNRYRSPDSPFPELREML
jgi:hypothetical protein